MSMSVTAIRNRERKWMMLLLVLFAITGIVGVSVSSIFLATFGFSAIIGSCMVIAYRMWQGSW